MRIPNPESTIFFLCDLQTKFRPAIAGFDQLAFSANKLLRLAKIVGCEVVCCTQAAKSLGPIDPAVDLQSLGPLHVGTFDKNSFSMLTPEVISVLQARPSIKSVVLFGIEAHICVLQTALDLLAPSFRSEPYTPYVIADAVSSYNAFEVPLVLDQLRHEGAFITTTESIGFQLIRGSGHPKFKEFSQFIKEVKGQTTTAGEVLIQGRAAPKPNPVLKDKL